MGKCIRCGKPCPDGEQMCSDCRAWFQQKTGGASLNTRQTTTFGSNRKNTSQKNVSESQSYSNTVEETGAQTTADSRNNASAGKGPKIPITSGNAAKTVAGNGKLNVDKKTIGIIAGVAVVVVILAVVIGGGKGKKQQKEVASVSATAAEQTMETVQTAEESADSTVSTVADEAQTTAETESVGWTPDDDAMNLIDSIDAYVSGIDYGKISDKLTETTSEDDNLTLYYQDEKMVCAEKKKDLLLLYYYYDVDGSLIFAETYDDDANLCYFYYDGGQLLCWENYDTEVYYPDLTECKAANADNYFNEATSYLVKYPYQNNDDEYIFPHSDTELIKASDLEGMDAWQAKLARNEIIARHGRKFKTEELKEYFESCSWYEPTLEPEEFDNNYETILSTIEKENITTIQNYEKKMGYAN